MMRRAVVVAGQAGTLQLPLTDQTIQNAPIDGEISINSTLHGEPDVEATISGTVDLSETVEGQVGIFTAISAGECEPYLGPYTVTPKANNAQVLATENKRMLDDVTISKIPYWETSNEKGLTVYIADEV